MKTLRRISTCWTIGGAFDLFVVFPRGGVIAQCRSNDLFRHRTQCGQPCSKLGQFKAGSGHADWRGEADSASAKIFRPRIEAGFVDLLFVEWRSGQDLYRDRASGAGGLRNGSMEVTAEVTATGGRRAVNWIHHVAKHGPVAQVDRATVS